MSEIQLSRQQSIKMGCETCPMSCGVAVGGPRPEGPDITLVNTTDVTELAYLPTETSLTGYKDEVECSSEGVNYTGRSLVYFKRFERDNAGFDCDPGDGTCNYSVEQMAIAFRALKNAMAQANPQARIREF